MELFWAFEQMAHDAATETTVVSTEIISNRAHVRPEDTDDVRIKKWLDACAHVFRSLIYASAGKNFAREAALVDLTLALAAMQQERLDAHAIAAAPIDLDRVFEIDWKEPSEAERTALNSMFLIARVREDDAMVRPGNLYVSNAGAGAGCPLQQCDVRRLSLAADILRCTKDQEYKSLLDAHDKLVREKAAKEQVDAAIVALNARTEIVASDCTAALLELTPACDFAQRSLRVMRFVAGLLVPVRKKDWILKEKESLRLLPPLSLPSIAGDVIIVLDALSFLHTTRGTIYKYHSDLQD